MTNQIQLTESQTLEIDKTLRGIACRKQLSYEHFPQLKVEDVVQELWISTLDLINKHGRVDMPLIARAAYQKVVDLVRHEIARPVILIDQSRFEYNGDESAVDSDSSFSYVDTEFNKRSIVEADQYTELNEILNLFEKGSKAEKLLKLVAQYFCNVDDVRGQAEDEDYEELKVRQDNYFWNWVAKKIGYANSSSSGFQKVRWQVRWGLKEAGYADAYSKFFN